MAARLLMALGMLCSVWACTEAPDVVATMSNGQTDGLQPKGDAGVDGGDAGACDLDQALRNAGLPPESVIVAATCQLPASWLDQAPMVEIGQDDLARLLEENGPIMPDGGAPASELCGGPFGFWYYEDPLTREQIILCPGFCEFIRAAVVNRAGDLDCSPMPPMRAQDFNGFPFPSPGGPGLPPGAEFGQLPDGG